MCNAISISVSEYNAFFLSNDVNNMLQNNYFAGLYVYIYTHTRIHLHRYTYYFIITLAQT